MAAVTPTADIIGRRIKAARIVIGLSVADFAEEIGWSAYKQYRLEAGDQLPNAIELAAIAEKVRQPVAWLLGNGEAA